MSYVGLARKWRPQKFSELVGQGPIAKTLENAIRLGRVSHALLLTGSRGVGKTTTARILAKGLNCEKGPTTEPCGECSNCREITAGTSMDVLEVDGASNTKVDEIRELLDNVQYRPNKSRSKIYIIDEVHMLSTHSFNALLKTLEEPPPGVMFIFATTEPHKIPDTIHSRCQRFDFHQISEEQIVSHLKKIVETEKIRISSSALEIVARQADGSLRDALSLLDQVVAFAGETISDEEVASTLGLTDRQLIAKTLEAFSRYDADAALTVVGEVFTKGFDPKNYLSEILHRVRDLMVLKIGADSKLVSATAEETADFAKLASALSVSEIERWFDLLRFATQDVTRSEFPRFLTEAAFLKITRKPVDMPLVSIVERLESLESKLSGAAPRTPSVAKPVVVEAPKPAVVVASSSAAAPSDPKRWEELVSAVKRKKPPLAAILLQAAKVDVAAAQIRLGYEEGSFYAARAKELDFQDMVCRLASELFGNDFKMVVETFGRSQEATPSAGQTDKLRQREALENPVVQRAVSLFDARVEEVKPIK